MEFCIDAYNVIFKLASLGGINISSDEAFSYVREFFITQMTNYFNFRQTQGTLVFDGSGPGWMIGSNKIQSKFLQIKYSGKKTADEIMINYIRNHEHPSSITVVTEDNEILAVAKVHSCRIISSTDFITRLTTVIEQAEKASSGRHKAKTVRKKHSRASDRKKKIVSHLHFADIEDEFRKIDMNDILKELSEEDGIDYTND